MKNNSTKYRMTTRSRARSLEDGRRSSTELCSERDGASGIVSENMEPANSVSQNESPTTSQPDLETLLIRSAPPISATTATVPNSSTKQTSQHTYLSELGSIMSSILQPTQLMSGVQQSGSQSATEMSQPINNQSGMSQPVNQLASGVSQLVNQSAPRRQQSDPLSQQRTSSSQQVPPRYTQSAPSLPNGGPHDDRGQQIGPVYGYMVNNRNGHGDGHRRLAQRRDGDMGQPRGRRGDNMYYKPKVPEYSGRENWSTFIYQFEVVAGIYGWNGRDCKQNLMTVLSGPAADYAVQLEEYGEVTYPELVQELDRRFNVKQTKEMSQRMFHSRRLEQGEKPRDFAAALKCLLPRAYPRLPIQAQNDLLLRQFFDGFNDENLVYDVQYLQRPRTIDEATDMVQEYIAFRGRRKQRDGDRRQVRMVCPTEDDYDQPADFQPLPTPPKQPVQHIYDDEQFSTQHAISPQQPSESSNLKVEEEVSMDEEILVKALRAFKQNGHNINYNDIKVIYEALKIAEKLYKGNQGRNDITCFKCGEKGHFSKECTSVKSTNMSSVECYKCGNYGHFARTCTEKTSNDNSSQEKLQNQGNY